MVFGILHFIKLLEVKIEFFFYVYEVIYRTVLFSNGGVALNLFKFEKNEMIRILFKKRV